MEISMKTAEKTTSQPWRLTPQVCWAFCSAVCFGLLVHGAALWNKFSWHDDIFALFSVGSTISSGRWMLHVLGWLETLVFGDGHFSLPAVNGVFSICCIGASAGMLVHLLEIRKRRWCAAVGCLMVSFPAVAGLFGYMFTLPYYMLAMGMMTAGACQICSGKKGWMKAAAVLLGGCSMGIYQTFVPMLLSIFVLHDLRLLAEKEEPVRAVLKQALIQLVCGLAVLGFYLVMNRFFLQKFGLTMNTYMGMNELEGMAPGGYLARLGRAYREFFLPTRNVSADMYPMHAYYAYLVMLVLDLLLGARMGIRLWRADRGKAALFFLLLAVFPLANNLIYVMSETTHGLMTFSLVMQIVLLVWLVDRADVPGGSGAEKKEALLTRAVSGLAAAVLGFTGIAYARFDNQCYLKTAFQQQQAISYFTVLTARIKAVPGFREDMPVAFLNAEKIHDGTLYNIDELDFIHLEPYGADMEDYVNSYAWRSFMERWCGFSPVWADPTDWKDRPEVREMPHYPEDGSIRKVGEVLLVNF